MEGDYSVARIYRLGWLGKNNFFHCQYVACILCNECSLLVVRFKDYHTLTGWTTSWQRTASTVQIIQYLSYSEMQRGKIEWSVTRRRSTKKWYIILMVKSLERQKIKWEEDSPVSGSGGWFSVEVSFSAVAPDSQLKAWLWTFSLFCNVTSCKDCGRRHLQTLAVQFQGHLKIWHVLSMKTPLFGFDVITSFLLGYTFGGGTTAHRHSRNVPHAGCPAWRHRKPSGMTSQLGVPYDVTAGVLCT